MTYLFPCLVFSLCFLCPYCTTAACTASVSRGSGRFVLSCGLLLGRSNQLIIIFDICGGRFFRHGSRASNQALALSDDIVNRQHSQFLAMATAMAVAFLRFVLEDNQLLAACLLNRGCKHQCIVHERCANHRGILV